jgi:hypothetical protein
MTSNITWSRLCDNSIQWPRQPPSSFVIYDNNIGSSVAEVSECFTMQAAREAVAENEE